MKANVSKRSGAVIYSVAMLTDAAETVPILSVTEVFPAATPEGIITPI